MASSNSVVVKLGGTLAELAGTKQLCVELPGEPTLAEVAALVGVAPNLVMLYAVNGTLRAADYRPSPGDEVLLIPAVAGGQLTGR
ncbi:MAG: MoaD/ThiS family protein [Chloroflexi bacterium]|nr:MoaD/ThiS family protein [Chloroflexota bacterium]MCL5107678.1 MoaD/ThiS family protein [Chloroflexota bacterium]